MAKSGLVFENSEKVKEEVMKKQQKEVADLYNSWADEIGEKAKMYKYKTNSSAQVSAAQMKALQKQLKEASKELSKNVEKKIKENMYLVSDAIVEDNNNWLNKLGFSPKLMSTNFTGVSTKVTEKLVSGKIYKGGWNLSSRIWGDNDATLKDIYTVMAQGLAENKSIYEISKDLETYVKPDAKLPWNLSMKDKNGKPVRIYKKQVDYNAQRLARTLTQHSYQQGFIEVTKDNPFVSEYIWRSNGSRVCELCKARDGKRFAKDSLPMDHPNGMCTMEPVIVEDMDEKIVDWANSVEGTYPDIDKFAENFDYNAVDSMVKTSSDYVKKYGTSNKTVEAWHQSLTPLQKSDATKLKKESGLTWKNWYKESGVYTGEESGISTATKKAAKKNIKKVKLEASKIPDTDDWINIIKKQEQQEILDKEDLFWSSCKDKKLKEGIEDYTDTGYVPMNRYRRKLAEGLSKDEAVSASRIRKRRLEELEYMIEEFDKIGLDKDYVLRRGTDVGDIAGLFMQGDFYSNEKELMSMTAKELANKFEGAIGEYSSFTSTSSLWNKGFADNVEMVIYAPKGTSAVSIMRISHYGTSEGETLLNAGTRVKCAKIEELGMGKRHMRHLSAKIRVYLEIIQ